MKKIYVHVKNIEKYNPGYTDRKHIWCKIYWEIFIDEKYQMLDEIDRHRLIGLIVFETYTQKPVCLTPVNVTLLGWNTEIRSISLTLEMLHTFIDVRNENVTQSRVEESRVEESRGASPSALLKDIVDKCHKKGFKVQVLINKFKAEQRKAKSTAEVPEDIYIAVCNEFLARTEPLRGDAWPYFMRVLKRKVEENNANNNIKEHEEIKGQKPVSIGDILNNS